MRRNYNNPPMKRSYFVPPALAAGILGIAGQSVVAQTTVFSDTFGNGSTVQTTPSTPTANSTTYEWFQQGGTPTTPTIAPGDLHLAGRTTSSSIAEVQALFTSTPVTLQNVGDTLTFTIAFTDTQNIFPTSSASTINVGLFNSGGSAPVTGVRLDSTGSGTGGAVGWLGYVGRISGSTSPNSSIITRPAQGAGLTNPNQSQDALFNGASGSSTYNNPTGALIANSGGVFAGLTQLSTYTLSYSITMSAAGALTISDSLSDSGNNVLFSQTGTTTGTPLTTSFDALGFGWRYNSASGPSSIDVSSINVTESLGAVPEPTTAALALAGFGFFLARRFRR
jgi:hypothetical protein